eukprot:1156062-Pelagomonas_calceolata.AAC.5
MPMPMFCTNASASAKPVSKHFRCLHAYALPEPLKCLCSAQRGEAAQGPTKPLPPRRLNVDEESGEDVDWCHLLAPQLTANDVLFLISAHGCLSGADWCLLFKCLLNTCRLTSRPNDDYKDADWCLLTLRLNENEELQRGRRLVPGSYVPAYYAPAYHGVE